MAKVIGTIWATQKHHNLEGKKLQIIQPLDCEFRKMGGPIVAVDTVGAGEIVLVAQGSSARLTEMTDKKPVDAVIMAIVDKFDIDPSWNTDE